MSLKYLRTALVAAGVLASGTAMAASFTNTSGDPFLGSEDVLYTSDGSPIIVPGVGYTNTLVIHNFFEASDTFSGGNQFLDYSPTFTTTFYTDTTYTTPTATADLTGGTFDTEILGRTSATETGTFSLEILNASFSGVVAGSTTALTTQIIPGQFAPGMITITEDASGVFTFTRVTNPPTEFALNMGPFTVDQPITAVSLPNTAAGTAPPNTNTPAVAEPASLTLLGVALAGMAFILRRRIADGSSQHLICNA